VHGPHIIIVENLPNYFAGLNKSDWRQVPTKRAFIELCRAKKEQDSVLKLWKRAEEKKGRALERAARPEKRLLHGGLLQVGYARYNSDGYRVFNVESIKPYTDLRFDARVQNRKGKVGVRSVAMRRTLTPDIVCRFYSLWRDASGYCNPYGSLRKLIVPIKEKIMVWLLAKAKSKGWHFGVKFEGCSQASILYIDTPEGQVSFHRPPEEFSLPVYAGEWSGIRNSDLIIRKLLGEDVCTTPAAKTPTLPAAIDAPREMTA
jgi:hypothetical protein